VKRSGGRTPLGLACVVVLSAVAAWLPAALASSSASAATRPSDLATSGARVARELPLGLDSREHAALQRAGAYGGKPIRLLIVGDSIALTLGAGLSVQSQPSYGVAVEDHATLGCDLDPQIAIRNEGATTANVQGCSEWRALWPFLVARLRPQVVALGLGRWEVTDHLLNGQWVHIGQPTWDHHLTAEMEQAITVLHSFGARVVLLTMPYIDPSQRQANGQPFDEDTPSRAEAYNALVRQVARRQPRVVSVIDLNHMLAPGGAYAATVDGVVVRSSDGIHISPAGGELLQSEILPDIALIGLRAEPSVVAATKSANRTKAAGTRKQG
jgi:hypothetical protein